MGHTVWSQRITLDIIIGELSDYGKSLRASDREQFEQLLHLPLLHVGSITYASSMHVWAFLLLSIALEQEKKIKSLGERIEGLADGCLSEGKQASPLAQDFGRQ
jgi:hypothetical protein